MIDETKRGKLGMKGIAILRLSAFFFLFHLSLLVPANAWAGQPQRSVEAWVEGVGRKQIQTLTELGVDIDAVLEGSARIYATPEQIQALEAMGYRLQIVPLTPEKMVSRAAGYHTYEELVAELQDVAADYPAICKLVSVGQSVQGRELWFMKISDQVETEEDEPEFSYISTMHGNEPVGMELCLNLIRLLVETYESAPSIARLVDEMEIWIMPLMNPDGYVAQSRYNAQWYDLNREFPDRVDDPVNSPDGRPPEVRHIMNWGFAHSPVLAANLHGGAEVVNYPYDSDPDPMADYSASPDDALFIQQSLTYASLNPLLRDSVVFPGGITNGVAWYQAKGGMQDWHYVWLGCNHVTIELEKDKWPDYSEISSIWEDNREAMLAYMGLCLKGVRGIVRDEKTGQPVAATVRVVGIEHDVYTDPDAGDYHRMLLAGTYDIRFHAGGYHSKVCEDVEVGQEDAVRLDVLLVPFPGDLNGDDSLDLKDAVIGLQVMSGKSAQLYERADTNGDGAVGLEDVVFIFREIL